MDEFSFVQVEKSVVDLEQFSIDFGFWKSTAFLFDGFCKVSRFHEFENHVEIHSIIEKSI